MVILLYILYIPGGWCGCEVMVNELPPLHDHHGELLGVMRLISVNHGAYYTRVWERSVGYRPPELFNSITMIMT